MAITLIEELRYNVGDISEDFQILPDDTYAWLLTKYGNNVKACIQEAARYCLFGLASFPTRERTGQIEVWNDWANTYRKALEYLLKDITLSTALGGVLIPYASGISKEDMAANDAVVDNLRPSIYAGFGTAKHAYNDSVLSTGFRF
jgi:hypothetical protein